MAPCLSPKLIFLSFVILLRKNICKHHELAIKQTFLKVDSHFFLDFMQMKYVEVYEVASFLDRSLHASLCLQNRLS